mgnify:CR=1 FL=1
MKQVFQASLDIFPFPSLKVKPLKLEQRMVIYEFGIPLAATQSVKGIEVSIGITPVITLRMDETIPLNSRRNPRFRSFSSSCSLLESIKNQWIVKQ